MSAGPKFAQTGLYKQTSTSPSGNDVGERVVQAKLPLWWREESHTVCCVAKEHSLEFSDALLP